jgi:hypothetical protein
MQGHCSPESERSTFGLECVRGPSAPLMLTLQFSQRVPTGKQAGNVEEDTVEITSKRINRLLRSRFSSALHA